jgi:hypothetical protein
MTSRAHSKSPTTICRSDRGTLRLVGAALAAILPAGAHAQGPSCVRTPRIELMSIVYRLAGSDIYNQGRVPSHTVIRFRTSGSP